jgi:hypothetical protein
MRPAAEACQHAAPRPGSRRCREANKLALVSLDVLAGARLPAQAAEALELSLPRYYQLEQRVLTALVAACEPRGRGPRPNPERERLSLERQVARLTQECARQQALVRAAQRTIGLAPPAPLKPAAAREGAARKKRQRKPTVRALTAARRLREQAAAQDHEGQSTDVQSNGAAATLAAASPDSPSPVLSKGESS